MSRDLPTEFINSFNKYCASIEYSVLCKVWGIQWWRKEVSPCCSLSWLGLLLWVCHGCDWDIWYTLRKQGCRENLAGKLGLLGMGPLRNSPAVRVTSRDLRMYFLCWQLTLYFKAEGRWARNERFKDLWLLAVVCQVGLLYPEPSRKY